VSTGYQQDTQRPVRLQRSRDDRVISGVAAGIAEYLGTDPVVVRLIFVVLALAGGGGVLAYLVAWLIVPDAGDRDGPPPPPGEVGEEGTQPSVVTGRTRRTEPSVLVGLVLVALGAGLLIERIVPGFSWRFAGPALLVALGVLLVSRGRMGR
jgi:phage shock protein C